MVSARERALPGPTPSQAGVFGLGSPQATLADIATVFSRINAGEIPGDRSSGATTVASLSSRSTARRAPQDTSARKAGRLALIHPVVASSLCESRHTGPETCLAPKCLLEGTHNMHADRQLSRPPRAEIGASACSRSRELGWLCQSRGRRRYRTVLSCSTWRPPPGSLRGSLRREKRSDRARYRSARVSGVRRDEVVADQFVELARSTIVQASALSTVTRNGSATNSRSGA